MAPRRARKHDVGLRVRRGATAQAQPIALPDYLEDRGVREKAVEDRGRRRDVAQEQAPVLRGSVGGDQCRCRFMAAHEHFEEVFCCGRAEFLHPEVFEDEQIDLRELPDEIAARTGRVGLREVRDEIEGAAHKDAVPRVNGADGDGRRDVRLADPGGAHDMMPTNSRSRCSTRGTPCTGRCWRLSGS